MLWVALAIVASVAMIVYRAERVFVMYLDRSLAIREKEIALEERVKSVPQKRPPVPPDLEAIAERETEAWAREQVRAAMQDDYDAHGDWDEVRNLYFGVK